MSEIRAVFLDLSGVLYDGSELISGAIDAVARLRHQGLILRFVTNTATQNQQQIWQKLSDFGFDLSPDEIFSAPVAARSYLKAHQLMPFALVHPAIQPLYPKGEQPNAVLIGDSREQFDYAHLNRAFQLCQAGAPLIAIAKNRYFKDSGQLQLDSGAFVQAIEWAAGVQAIITGKPSLAFFEMVVKSTTLKPEQCLMVGDDVESDVIGAIDAGLQAFGNCTYSSTGSNLPPETMPVFLSLT